MIPEFVFLLGLGALVYLGRQRWKDMELERMPPQAFTFQMQFVFPQYIFASVRLEKGKDFPFIFESQRPTWGRPVAHMLKDLKPVL